MHLRRLSSSSRCFPLAVGRRTIHMRQLRTPCVAQLPYSRRHFRNLLTSFRKRFPKSNPQERQFHPSRNTWVGSTHTARIAGTSAADTSKRVKQGGVYTSQEKRWSLLISSVF